MQRIWFLFFMTLVIMVPLSARSSSILVVHSYHESMPWVQEVNEGIEQVLHSHQVHYFYLDTKNSFEKGQHRAEQAWQFYLKTGPDGVIAVDDNAQSMFVVPYLKDKVNTPVMFSGVNARPEKYGYPASNVSGILERQHFAEAIAMMKQLSPGLTKVAFMMKAGPTADLIIEELKGERYLADVVSYNTPHTVTEAMEDVDAIRETCDAIYITNLTGLKNSTGDSMSDEALFPMVAERFGKPLFSGSSYNIRFPGVLVAVAKTGQEQGSTAAKMLLRAIGGTPVAQIPITRNRYGKRMINVSVLRSFGLTPDPIVLRGVELVKTEEIKGLN